MMNREKLIKLLEKENKNRMNIKNVKFRDCHCMFNNYSQCYVNVKNKYENNDFWKYENIYGNDNIIKRSVQEEEEKKKWIEDNYNKESSLEFTYPYRYESNRNIFLIINSENINLGNSCVYNNDLIYIIHNNKRYEHMNLPKRTKKKKKKKKRKTKETKRKKRTLHNMKNDTFGPVTKKRKFIIPKYLIDLIYNLQEYLNPDDINKKVLLYLLKNITTPLFDFIKNYIFYGKVKDTYKEIFIHENKHITPVPKFLKKLSNHIFITGKYIDVLSACSKILNIQRKTSFYLIDQNEYKNINENIDINMDTNQNNRNSFLFPKDVIYKRIYNENINNDQYTNSDHIRNPYFYNDLYKSERQTQHGMNKQIINGKVKYNYMNLPYEDEYYEHNKNDEKNKSCFLIYDNDKKVYENLIHNQHLYASKKMFELYIKKIDIKEKIKHHYFFFFLQISDYLKYFYILSHEYLEKLYHYKKNNILNKLKNFFDISIRSSVLYHLKYKKDYNVAISDIFSIMDNVNLIIDLRKFQISNEQQGLNKKGANNYEVHDGDDDDDYYNNNGNEYNNYEEGYNDDEEERNNYLNKNDYDDEQEADDEEEDDDDDDDYDNDDDDEYKEY
ncbi:hypothetical protein PFDG_05554, partial [Plasmodium falciparum Dd2]